MTNVSESFKRLVEIVQKLGGGRNPVTGQVLETPKIIDDLNPPASDKAIQDLEKEIGYELSDDLRQLLSIHDGQTGKGPPALGHFTFCSISEMLNRYWHHKSIPGDKKMDQPADPQLQPYYWHQAWIPVASWEESELTVDLAPSNAGTKGQVFILERDWAGSKVIAPSLHDLILITIEKLDGANDFFFEYEAYAP